MTQMRSPHVTDEQMIEAYRQFHSIPKAARHIDVSVKRMELTLRRHQVQRDGLEFYRKNAQAYSPEIQAEIARLHAAGAPTSELARKFGGSVSSVKMAIIRSGGEILQGVTSRRKVGDKEAEAICAAYLSGKSQIDVAYEVGVSQPVVSRVLRERGAKMRNGPATKERHGMWAGGKIKTGGGYWSILVDRDDPLASMRNRSGYVLEHRLVMARALGRALRGNETVHHINGDRSDNRLENLQLRHGNHGKHVVLCCLNCGSQNIGPALISED